MLTFTLNFFIYQEGIIILNKSLKFLVKICIRNCVENPSIFISNICIKVPTCTKLHLRGGNHILNKLLKCLLKFALICKIVKAKSAKGWLRIYQCEEVVTLDRREKKREYLVVLLESHHQTDFNMIYLCCTGFNTLYAIGRFSRQQTDDIFYFFFFF